MAKHSPLHKRSKISPAKATEMLKNPPGTGSNSPAQVRLFQMIKHGGKPTRLGGKKRR